MAENGVDGAFLQRFLGATEIEGGDERSRNLRDEIGDRVQEAAEKEGRVFAIMYVLRSSINMPIHHEGSNAHGFRL